MKISLKSNLVSTEKMTKFFKWDAIGRRSAVVAIYSAANPVLDVFMVLVVHHHNFWQCSYLSLQGYHMTQSWTSYLTKVICSRWSLPKEIEIFIHLFHNILTLIHQVCSRGCAIFLSFFISTNIRYLSFPTFRFQWKEYSISYSFSHPHNDMNT